MREREQLPDPPEEKAGEEGSRARGRRSDALDVPVSEPIPEPVPVPETPPDYAMPLQTFVGYLMIYLGTLGSQRPELEIRGQQVTMPQRFMKFVQTTPPPPAEEEVPSG